MRRWALERRAAMLSALAFVLILAHGSFAPLDIRDPGALRLSPAELAGLRDGDIVFRKAPGLPSDYIVQLDGDTEFSHGGIIHLTAGGPHVIHAAFDDAALQTGVFEEPLEHFLATSPVAGIYRLTEDRRARAGQVAQAALALAGTPFDFKLDMDDAGALYCTEFLWVVFRRAGIDLLDRPPAELVLPVIGSRPVILPSDIARSSKLRNVMYLTTHSSIQEVPCSNVLSSSC